MKRSIIGLSFILFSLLSCTQNYSLPAPEANYTAIIVSNIEHSITWNSTIFGFKVLYNIDSKERGFKQANLKRENMLIELIESKSAVSPKELLESHQSNTKIRG